MKQLRDLIDMPPPVEVEPPDSLSGLYSRWGDRAMIRWPQPGQIACLKARPRSKYWVVDRPLGNPHLRPDDAWFKLPASFLAKVWPTDFYLVSRGPKLENVARSLAKTLDDTMFGTPFKAQCRAHLFIRKAPVFLRFAPGLFHAEMIIGLVLERSKETEWEQALRQSETQS